MLWYSNRLDGGGYFPCAAGRTGVVEEAVDIQVDAQLPHLAIIIRIEDMLFEFVFLGDVALRTLHIVPVLVVVGIVHAAVIAARVAVVLVEGTETVVLVHHVVHLQLRRPALPDIL